MNANWKTQMSQIKITYAMTDADADDKKLHNRLIDLLDAVDRHGSLAAAVEAEFDSSYRHVWNELKSWEENRAAAFGARSW